VGLVYFVCEGAEQPSDIGQSIGEDVRLWQFFMSLCAAVVLIHVGRHMMPVNLGFSHIQVVQERLILLDVLRMIRLSSPAY